MQAVSIHVIGLTIHVCKNLFLLRTVHHQNVSIAVALIIRVTCKNIKNPNSLAKCVNEQFDVTMNVSNFLYSHCIAAYLLIKSHNIQFLLDIIGFV
jgi:hypothetical protein